MDAPHRVEISRIVSVLSLIRVHRLESHFFRVACIILPCAYMHVVSASFCVCTINIILQFPLISFLIKILRQLNSDLERHGVHVAHAQLFPASRTYTYVRIYIRCHVHCVYARVRVRAMPIIMKRQQYLCPCLIVSPVCSELTYAFSIRYGVFKKTPNPSVRSFQKNSESTRKNRVLIKTPNHRYRSRSGLQLQ